MADVDCIRCLKTGGVIEQMSYGGKIGAALKEKVCNACWIEWYAQSIKVINEYRLNLREASDREVLSTQMKIFFRMLPAPQLDGVSGLPLGTPPPALPS